MTGIMETIDYLKKNIKNLLRIFLPWGRRNWVANTYIRGAGIEIGALHNPLRLPKSAKVKYVDKMSAHKLSKHYPELNSRTFVKVDLIDDGELLASIQDNTQDFVIANHFLEHCENPISSIGNMLRILKNDGILYISIPDKRYTFDIDRPVTSMEHLMNDYQKGPDWSRRMHFEEWAKLVDKVQDHVEIEKYADHLMNIDYSIHFHVWTQTEMLELMLAIKKIFHFEFELFVRNGPEMIIILKKSE